MRTFWRHGKESTFVLAVCVLVGDNDAKKKMCLFVCPLCSDYVRMRVMRAGLFHAKGACVSE